MQDDNLENENKCSCITTITSPNSPIEYFPQFEKKSKHTLFCPRRVNVTVSALWVATPLLSTVSVVVVCVAVSTNQWLLTKENIKNGNYTSKGDQELFPKNTVSGLWTLCYTNPGKPGFLCTNIEYFPKEEYSPDLKDSTMAIPYTVTKSAVFFILSTFLLFVAEFCCLCGHLSRQRRLLTFISGVIFIISGLLMLIGLVMYISIFKAEIGGKLRPSSQLQPAVFTYKYGYSFILYVSGFISTEMSGTCAIYLYISWHQKDWRKKDDSIRAKFDSPAFFFDLAPSDELQVFCKKHSKYVSSNNDIYSVSNEIANYVTNVERRLYLDRHEIITSEEEYSPVCLNHSCSMINELLSNNMTKKQNKMIDTSDLDHSSFSNGRDEFIPCYSDEIPFPKLSSLKNKPQKKTLDQKEMQPHDSAECSFTADYHEFVLFDLGENVITLPNKCKTTGNFTRDDEYHFKVISKTTPV